jgi:hypothetical protein
LSVLFAISFAVLLVVPQLLALVLYLALVWRTRHRRTVAIALSPLAVAFLLLITESFLEAAVVLVAGAAYGASLWFPAGPPAWWQRRPLLIAAAAGWIVLVAAIGIVQPRSAGVQTDVTIVVREGNRSANYRLRCEYDRAGRVRRAVGGGEAHPGGMRACEILDDAVRTGGSSGDPLQTGCPSGRRSGQFTGTVRGEPFGERIVAAECEGDSFVDGEANLLVPAVGG